MKVKTKDPKSDSSARVDARKLNRLRADLARADRRIATLTSELQKQRADICALLSDDLRNNDALAELADLIWQCHGGQPGGCDCCFCAEVEQSRIELAGLT